MDFDGDSIKLQEESVVEVNALLSK